MSDVKPEVPVWLLTTEPHDDVPLRAVEGALTPERLDSLRSALATFAEAPLVTLEAHPLASKSLPSAGLALDAVSPLARELSRLVTASAKNLPVTPPSESGEILYRMVVPAKVAAQVGKGLLRPMKSTNVPGGVYSTLVDQSSKAVSHAAYVPVAPAAAAGTAVGTAAAGTALTVAAPLVLMAVAVSASAYADHQREKAIERIADLLEKLHDERLEMERSELDGCRDSIDKAAGLLLDRGKVGVSLGLDSAVHAISKATETASRRLQKWEKALESLVDGRIDPADLEVSFPGIGEEGGEFRAQLELAGLAIALKRRVVVLQAVEAAQSDPANPFENFVRSLHLDQQRIDDLEARITHVLVRLSRLELSSPKRLIERVMTRNQVDELLKVTYRVRALAEEVRTFSSAEDVVIEIERHGDGTLLVLPARAAA